LGSGFAYDVVKIQIDVAVFEELCRMHKHGSGDVEEIVNLWEPKNSDCIPELF